MATEFQELHIVVFPFMANGHMIPALDIARLFAARGLQATIITTPLNMPMFSTALGKIGASTINIEVIKFPTQEYGLPDGCENMALVGDLKMMSNFINAAIALREQLEQCLEKLRPACLVADVFFPWATDAAAKYNIPRLVFHGFSNFALCAAEVHRLYEPYNDVSSDEETFVIPLLPHEIKLSLRQLPPGSTRKQNDAGSVRKTSEVEESELKSYGVVINSFYGLEPNYSEFFKKELGRRAWNIGPVSLCNRSMEDKLKANSDEHECLKWLDSKKADSVVYISFGSTSHIVAAQLREIAMALEVSEQAFIWVVRMNDDQNSSEEWLPPGFETRMKGKGLIIREWAPQVQILEHEATGTFLTHCGWNSIIEGISAGVPMVTWPLFADQFYNEKLVVEILKIGVPSGADTWTAFCSAESSILQQDSIHHALREIMVGEEAEDRRRRARNLKEMAWKAVQEGGSSHTELSSLLNELKAHHINGAVVN